MEEGRAGELFYELIKDSRSLICCRSSPSQKSKIVEFIKKNSDELTLAIGDGGNDVNMIKSAHVGIGIFGKEGYQAAYNSDYAISQFKYLKRLLFIDGRFSLARNSYFIYHYFFKNVMYAMSQFYYQIFSKFSGRGLFDEWYATAFNSFFTVVPIAVRAVTEEDFDANFTKCTRAEKRKLPYLFPDIYKEFRESQPFNIIKFTLIYMIGFLVAIIYYIVPAFSFYREFYGNRGYAYSFWDVSWETMLGIIVVHFFMVFQDTLYYIKFNILFYILQIVVNILVLVIINSINLERGMDDTLWFIMGNWYFWLSLIAVCGIIGVPFYILRKAEFFFGGFIVNLILQKKINYIYLVKYCQKKVEEMTRVNRSVAKFIKIYKNRDDNVKIDNFADQQMKKIVDEFRVNRKRIKKSKKANKIATNNNINPINNNILMPNN
jgi:phospholipid-translocating ATPase